MQTKPAGPKRVPKRSSARLALARRKRTSTLQERLDFWISCVFGGGMVRGTSASALQS